MENLCIITTGRARARTYVIAGQDHEMVEVGEDKKILWDSKMA